MKTQKPSALSFDESIIDFLSENDKMIYCICERAIVYFEVVPEYRGKGVATALLERTVADATAEGCNAVEGFPHKRRKRYEWDFTEPIRLL